MIVYMGKFGIKLKVPVWLIQIARCDLKIWLLVALGLCSTLTPALAGCISDCRDQYESDVEDCKNQYDDPDDADDLRRCIQEAKETFDECQEDCRS
jgi:hypothetical protein